MKYRSIFVAIAVLSTISVTSATALDIQNARSLLQLQRQGGMRVTASFQTIVPITGQKSIEEEAKITESARVSLYEIASHECDVIAKVFKGNCRIMNLNMRSRIQNRSNGVRQVSINASATYLVAPEEFNDSDEQGKKL